MKWAFLLTDFILAWTRCAPQGGHSGHLTPHTSFTASQQASTMSTRHTQSRHTHCQPTGTITWQSEYICPGTRGSKAALSRCSSLSPPHPLTLLSVASQQLSADSSKFPFFLSLFVVPSLSRLKPAAHIQTHIPTSTAPHSWFHNNTIICSFVQ